MKTYKEFINESGGGLSRITQHTKNRNIGTITAHRGDLTPEENNRRNDKLKQDIKDHGFSYKRVVGHYIENYGSEDKDLPERPVEEKSFLIIGKKGDDKGRLRDFLIKHGEKYNQDSVLHKAHDSDEAHLIGTNDTGHPGKGNTVSVGKYIPDRAGEFFSSHKGKNYKFESVAYYEPKPSKTFLNRGEWADVLIEEYLFD